jgi:septation ring formation regulator EzrA
MEELKELIKEQVESELEEQGGIFSRMPGIGQSARSQRGAPRRTTTPGGDDLDVRASEIEAGDSTRGLNKSQMKVYNAAVADSTSDMDKKLGDRLKDLRGQMEDLLDGYATDEDLYTSVNNIQDTMADNMVTDEELSDLFNRIGDILVQVQQNLKDDIAELEDEMDARNQVFANNYVMKRDLPRAVKKYSQG